MTLQAAAYVVVRPSFEEPELLMQWTQPSGFTHLLADGAPRTRLGSEDLLVYAKQINMRNRTVAGQASSNELMGVTVSAQQLSTATYRLQMRDMYNHHDTAIAGMWGFSLPEAYKLGHRQGHYQLARDACLFGMNPQNNEGVLNGPNAYKINLPADPYGNITFSTYDNGAFASFLLNQIALLKTRTLQMGIGQEFTVIGPQRDLSLFEYNIVQLTSFQRDGGGTDSSAGAFKRVLMPNGDSVIWTYDDSLIGAGAGSTDAIIIGMPELQKPEGRPPINLNVFADLAPNNLACIAQYCDMAAPMEITSPAPGGMTDYMTEWRISSGWPLRSEAVTIISGSN